MLFRRNLAFDFLPHCIPWADGTSQNVFGVMCDSQSYNVALVPFFFLLGASCFIVFYFGRQVAMKVNLPHARINIAVRRGISLREHSCGPTFFFCWRVHFLGQNADAFFRVFRRNFKECTQCALNSAEPFTNTQTEGSALYIGFHF